jgi:HSP20 family molecular chaperone IbpA
MVDKHEKSVAAKDINKAVEAAKGTIIPPVDIYEDTDGVTLFADLPGVSKESLDVQIEKDLLKIIGRRTPGNGADVLNRYDEIPNKDFYRAFTIGEEIDREKITATMNNGVLKLVLPKSERTKPKRIDIKVS